MSTLKRIDEQSAPGVESNLALFDLPPTNVAINRSAVRELLPLTTITQQGPYSFRLFADNQFAELGKTWLYLELSIQKEDNDKKWVPLAETLDDKNTGVIQNIGQSFVKQLKINVNNVEVSDSGPLYAYRTYMLHELGYSHEVRKGLHEANCYYSDEPDKQSSAEGVGFLRRKRCFSKGKSCYTMSKLNFDLALQPNLMLSNSDIIFTIYRNSDDFLLLTPDYQIPDPTDATGKITTRNNTKKCFNQQIR